MAGEPKGTVPASDEDGRTIFEENNDSWDQDHFTGADLAEIVKPSKELRTLAGKDLISDGEAEEMLIARMGGNKNEETSVTSRDLAEVIVDSLPDELLTAPAMVALDLRPYFDAIDGKKITHRQHTPWYLPDATGKIVASTGKFKLAEEQRLGVTADKDASKDYDKSAAGVTPVPPALDEQGKPIPEAAPVVDPVTGELTEEPFPDLATEQVEERPVTLNDLVEMVNSDQADLEWLAANEGQVAGGFPVDLGLPYVDPNPGQRTPGRASRNKALTAQEALGYLQSLPPEKIRETQQKLANAGYFDELSNGGNYLPGDAHDPNTIVAMRAMILDTIHTGQSMPKLLGERTKSYRQSVREQRLGRVAKFDKGYQRALANDWGQTVLGRNLRDDELDDLENHLKNVISKRAGYVVGAKDNQATEGIPGINNEAGAMVPGFDETDVVLQLGDDPSLVQERKERAQARRSYMLQKAVPG